MQQTKETCFLGALYLSQGASDQAFDHSSTVIMKEMDLVDDEEFDQLCEGDIPSALTCDNIPLLWSGYQHLEKTEIIRLMSSFLFCGLLESA